MRTLWHPLVPLVALATLALATPARAQVQDPIPYTLASPSWLGHGCAQPCMCAWFVRGPLAGGFNLQLTGMDPLFAHYALLDIVWRFALPDGAGGTQIGTVTGHGTYEAGGAGNVLVQRMQLDLTTEDGFAHHYDSGSVANRPLLDVEVAMGHACHDSMLRVVALPLAQVPPGGPGVRLTAAPNPARAGTDIVLVLPESAPGQVDVVSVAGRTVATLANGVFPAGENRWHWDGRTAAGADAGVGVFWVRARLGSPVNSPFMNARLASRPQTLSRQFVRLR